MPLPPALLERLKRRKIIQDHRDANSSPIGSKGAKSHDQQTRNESRKSSPSKISADQEPEEEIIAEDYSDDAADGDGDSDESQDRTAASNHSGEAEDCTQPSRTQLVDDHNTGDVSDDESVVRGKFVDCPIDETDLQNQPSESDSKNIDLKIYESVIGCPNKYNIYHVCGQYCRDKYSNPDAEQMHPTKKQRKQLALLLKTFPMSNDWTVVFDPGVRTFYFWNIITNHVSWVPPGMGTFASPAASQIRRAYMDADPSLTNIV